MEEGSTANAMVLALLPEKGCVRRCPSGCLHVTYGPITLNFRNRQAFAQLSERMGELRAGAGEVRLQYHHATLRFRREEFAEFAGMVTEADHRLAELEVVRRLIEGPASH